MFFDPFKELNGTSLGLYRRHFLLFNSLYILRDSMLSNKEGDIEVSPFSVKIIEYSHGPQQIGKAESLRDYYFDLENLTNSSEENVSESLNSIWELYLKNDKCAEALSTLGLQDPIDDQEIIMEYRRQVMHHHPDRSGDVETFKLIKEAYSHLIEKV